MRHVAQFVQMSATANLDKIKIEYIIPLLASH